MKIDKRGSMLLPVMDKTKDPKDACRKAISNLRDRYPGVRSVTIRTVKGEVQIFAHGIAEFSEQDRVSVETEMKKAKLKKPA